MLESKRVRVLCGGKISQTAKIEQKGVRLEQNLIKMSRFCTSMIPIILKYGIKWCFMKVRISWNSLKHNIQALIYT